MKCIFFLLLMLSFSGLALAQDSLNNMVELKQLLKQRKDQFDTYATQAGERSGIFGNKTKKDLEHSREILLQIVTIDNRIMDELNRAISNRGLAKADYSLDLQQYQQTINQLTQAADTLEKQTIELRQTSEQNHHTISMQTVAIVLLSVLSVFLFLRTYLLSRK